MEKFVAIYFAHIPFLCDGYVPDIRKKEIESCNNFKVKQEKFYIWKLLETAIKECFDVDPKEVVFNKLDNGKWVCDRCFFSLSHSHGIVCVAVSDAYVGVDIEYMDTKRHPLNLVNKTVHKNEKCETENDFFPLWTMKEAWFKYSNDNNFVPNKIDTTALTNVKTDFLNIGAERYVWSVVGDNINNIKVYFK